MKKFLVIPALFLSLLVPSSSEAMSLRNKEKSQTAGEIIRGMNSQNQQVEHTVQGQPTPAPNVNVGGTNNSVDIEIVGNPQYKQQTSVNSKSNTQVSEEREETNFLKVKFPLWVSLLGLVIAGFGFLFLIKYARKQFAAADAAFKMGDQVISKWINEAREKAMVSDSPHEMARLNAEIAAMNEERGKLTAARFQK